MSILFDPLKMGPLTLPNRIIMAPLTRSRAHGDDRIPNTMMAKYYAQRASAGLIISEATSICPQGVGYANTPGIWSDQQVQGWQEVTKAVHEQGGRIFLQLWHVGRISDPIFLNDELPVAPSAVQPKGHVSLLRPERPFVIPRALEIDEIPGIIEAYRDAAERAKKAGFDGVELHAANGYLPDQFLQDSTNKRTDQYGGSLENRARFLLEATDALISVWGADRVGVHLSPRCDAHNMGDSSPFETFLYVVRQLNQRRIAFIFSRERQGDGYIGDKLKHAFEGVYIANQGLTPKEAESLILENKADAVAFGQLFIANPDLPARIKEKTSFNQPDSDTFYSDGAKGYTDYPALIS